jgi:multidrug efflux pump subunit AcrB
MAGVTDLSLNTSRVTISFLLFIAVAGALIYLDYPKQEDPSIVIREAVVSAAFPGMSPQRVEDLITRKLEETIREIPEVKEIKSDSKTGASIIHVIVKDQFFDLEPIWQDLRNKMDDVRPELPAGTQGPFVNDEYGLTALATIALWSDGFTLAEMREVARRTRDQLYTLKGIKKVELFGIQEERVFLELSSTKLAQYGISPRVVAQTLEAQNVILPGGKIEIAGYDVNIEPSGNFNDVDEIESVLISIPGTEKMTPLRDLVTTSRGYVDPPNQPVYFNGRPAIILSVSIMDGVNGVEFGERLTRKLHDLEQALPIGYRLDYATYQPDLIDKAVQGAVTNLYQTLVIVLVSVVLFLGVRTGLIVGAFVPMTMLLGLLVMSALGVEFQRMSIASMIISLGMLVDNAIVVAEDIRTRIEAGHARRQAVLDAGNSLSIPLLTSSLTTILAFAPMLVAAGATGEYTLSLAQVVTIVLLCSWFLALYMTPFLCYWFLKVEPRPAAADGAAADPYSSGFYRLYRRFLETMLRQRFVAIGLLGLALALSLYAFRYVVQEFFPPGDRNQYLVYLDLPAGTHITKTAEVVEDLGRWLLDTDTNPEITSTIGYVGSGGPRFFLSLAPIDPDPHVAFIVVNTQTNQQVADLVERTREHILNTFPEVRGRVKAMWLGATETGLFEVRLSGPDDKVLMAKADHLLEGLRAIPGTVDIMQDWENKIWKATIEIDQARARRAGVTSKEVADSLNAYIDGTILTEYREGDTVIPVVGRGIAAERNNPARLRTLNIFSNLRRTNVPISQIADFTIEGQLSRIKRRDQERTITVSAKHQVLKTGDLFEALQPTMETLDLPPGYAWAMGGELEKQAEAQGYLFEYLPHFVALAVLLLIWQFNSFRRTAIILLTIPMTLTGVVVGLLVMDATFGFMAILGLLSLAGVIVNNGIVLIDRIEVELAEGKTPYQAVVNSALGRFRPILMTTVTTILGLLTLIIARDPLFYGMAVVLAFGLAVGTVLTLGFVPLLYTLFFRVKVPPRGAATPSKTLAIPQDA